MRAKGNNMLGQATDRPGKTDPTLGQTLPRVTKRCLGLDESQTAPNMNYE